jgi:hypothetical protein
MWSADAGLVTVAGKSSSPQMTVSPAAPIFSFPSGLKSASRDACAKDRTAK